MNSAATSGHLNSLTFNESPGLQRVDVWLECHPPHKCGGQNAVHMRIVAEGNSHKVNWKNALESGSGYVLSLELPPPQPPQQQIHLVVCFLSHLLIKNVNFAIPCSQKWPAKKHKSALCLFVAKLSP